MKKGKLNLAILHPSNSTSYSETFIDAQKKLLPFNVRYYYGGNKPRMIEGEGSIISYKRKKVISYKLKKWFKNIELDYYEFQIAQSLLKNNIDVVLAHYGPTGQSMVEICKFLNLPLVVYFFGYDASMSKVIENNNYYKDLFDYASKVICVSNAMKAKLSALGCPNGKLINNICSPADDFFSIEATYSKHQFIGISRFSDKKAPYYTIIAFSEVLKTFPNAKLVLVGDGPLYNMCKNLIRYLKIEDTVKLIGPKSPDEYKVYLKESIAFVQHSITAENGDSEGVPVAILEASAAGLPIISTNHSGIPEVVIHEKTGILMEEHDVEGMTTAMINLLQDTEKAKVLGFAGKKFIRENHTMKKHIENLKLTIESVFYDQ